MIMNSKINIIVAGILIGTAVAAFAQTGDAASIVDKSRNRINADTVSTRSAMTIKAKNGSTTDRVMDQYSKDGPKGAKRTVIVFQSPAAVAGTRFLTMENPGSADDRRIFLPGLGKVRRMDASEGSGSFIGTDFSYDDIASASRNADLDRHTLVREESLNGNPCYVIESVPKDSSYQYSKMIQWIDKGNLVNHRIELYDKKGAHVKTLEILDLKDIQGRLTPMVTRMSTLAAGTSTTITVDEKYIKYDGNVPEGVFTNKYLETGRP
ncbi:outer membrane lipoprotein-sorting protein [Spirochaetia bacterium]|nr:outer membrane lipoprotein-sorting protein [Spirochaetia bacterium]